MQVIVVDRNNYHSFQPLLYPVATGALEANRIAYPIRKIFDGQRDFFYRRTDVRGVVPAQRLLTTKGGDIRYDYLVPATGSLPNFFGIKSVEDNAMQI